ncbi:MAG TPA: Nramp family divalent metal transporter [Blastocatellia bacterium]|nr:Nramp family divalent metal transporter [Blastocatellia bacterium]
MSNINDPYQLRPEDVIEPPKTFSDTLKRIGPGMILAASIVGSGELIATTTLGAKVGYTALWIIILSCLIKPVVQAELGRYVIATGETGLAGFNRAPGPRVKVNWIVWAWAAMTLMTMMQVGAMFGGVSQVMHLLIPAVSVKIWILIFLGITLALLLGGGYERIERLAMIKVGLFTMLTFLAALLLIRMPQYFSWDAFWSGFEFKMPGEGFADAVAVFGITGVGASELFMYPYWCVEKGYARFAGRRDGSSEWRHRARGWIRVMHTDIGASMLIYTVATIAFYLLGAGVLNGMKLVPKEGEMISTLSNIYTETLGGWSRWLFYAGAIITLYGTIFAATAANSRLFADMFRLMGAFSADDAAARARYRNFFIILLTVIPVALIFIFTDPVHMVRIGGIAQAMMLPVIGLGVVYLRHRHLPEDIRPSTWVTVGLWVGTALIVWLMGYSVIEAVRKML